MSQLTRLIPLTKWNEYHPWPSEAGIRNLVANAKAKNFTNVYVKAGGRILIDEQAFFAWAKSQGGQHGA